VHQFINAFLHLLTH